MRAWLRKITSISLLTLTCVVAMPFGARVTAVTSKPSDAFSKIPRGYQDGRRDAVYGTYFSIVKPPARLLQARVLNLENRVMGFSASGFGTGFESRVKQSEAEFLLEHAIFKLQLDISNAPDSVVTAFERESMLFANVRTYQSLRFQAERLFEDMVRFIDIQLPGPNGLQIRAEIDGDLNPIYLPNFRTDYALSQSERQRLYNEKLQAFFESGHSLSEIELLTPSLLKTRGAYTRFEYIVTAGGEIHVTAGNAGHILLSEGRPVLGAGQMIFLKDKAGQYSMAVISNSSGSFKPDIYSLLKIAAQISKMTSLPQSRIVMTKGEPMSTQAVKVYSKGLRIPKSVTDSRVARLEEVASDLEVVSAPPEIVRRCSSIFVQP